MLPADTLRPLFISGIGTGIGKTLVSAIVAQALGAAYWKPVQAGFTGGTDTLFVETVTDRDAVRIIPEVYRLILPASPHIAAREEGIQISLDEIAAAQEALRPSLQVPLVIEGAGGLMVPLNEREFVIDLARRLNARLILVSRNYLGSINHSLLTAAKCQDAGVDVAGWVFNDQYLDYTQEIVAWTGIPALFSLSFLPSLGAETVRGEARRVAPLLRHLI